eukprot:CAMPEP_0113849134 /NCGR_PEP_ID=MMETSP0372-20130328/2925_1 /TAXON_ID=340204 /ORGANISM="Lankesteria abbotti" /LENGTH=448 /DNA_ID=CAMNT_0000818817 /DNA_START=25 /DNA_END=1371 /DNA_ORIENTATION=+ /assembly_acc=CAM_ASM_000359
MNNLVFLFIEDVSRLPTTNGFPRILTADMQRQQSIRGVSDKFKTDEQTSDKITDRNVTNNNSTTNGNDNSTTNGNNNSTTNDNDNSTTSDNDNSTTNGNDNSTTNGNDNSTNNGNDNSAPEETGGSIESASESNVLSPHVMPCDAQQKELQQQKQGLCCVSTSNQSRPNFRLYLFQRCQRTDFPAATPTCSAFVGNSVMRNADPCLLSPFDPLFLMLPCLALEESRKMFVTLSDSVRNYFLKLPVNTPLSFSDPTDDCASVRHRQCKIYLQLAADPDVAAHVSKVCDVQQVCSHLHLRVNIDKLSAQLVKKVDKMMSLVKNEGLVLPECSTVCHSNHQGGIELDKPAGDLRRPEQPLQHDTASLARLCWDMLASFLPENLHREVGAKLKHPWEEPDVSLALRKRLASDTNIPQPVKAPKKAEQSVSAKDLKGVKTIASFFGNKGRKNG